MSISGFELLMRARIIITAILLFVGLILFLGQLLLSLIDKKQDDTKRTE